MNVLKHHEILAGPMGRTGKDAGVFVGNSALPILGTVLAPFRLLVPFEFLASPFWQSYFFWFRAFWLWFTAALQRPRTAMSAATANTESHITDTPARMPDQKRSPRHSDMSFRRETRVV
jgi:hypothetical protein